MATIIIEIPEDLKALEEPVRAVIELVAQQAKRGRQGVRVSYDRFCEGVSNAVGAIERGAHAAALAALDIDAEAITVDDELFRKAGRNPGTYYTKAGPVTLERSIYRKAGDRQGRTVDTISLRVGAAGDGWLPDAATAMAYLLQQGTSREAELTARQLDRLPYSRSSFDDVGHEVGRRLVARHQEIEETLIKRFDVPRAAKSVSVSLDRVALPMEEPRPRPPGRPLKGAPKKPVACVYRMAFCGTVTLHDAKGEALHTIRYGTMPGGDADSLCLGMAGDVLALLDKAPRLAVSLLCDGAPEMWTRLDAEFSDGFGVVTRRIDFYHLVEKLAAAAAVMVEPADRASVVRRWVTRLKSSNQAASHILAELHASGCESFRVGDQRPVHDAITYLTNNADRMQYASAIEAGLPIGSGAVEATCKSLVNQRMKRSGSRWKTTTGEHVIHLRAMALSDRWDDALRLTLPSPQVRILPAA